MRYNSEFLQVLSGFDLDTLEKSSDTIYALSPDLEFIYFNPSWFEFAKRNDMNPNALEAIRLGTPMRDYIDGQEISDFYLKNYALALTTGEVWRHEYECSSDQVYRLMQQTCYPLKKRKGLVIVNSLTREVPMDQSSHKGIKSIYRQTNGYMNECSNCRRFQRADHQELWDWVPSWVKKQPKKVSHTICPICFDFFWKHAG